MKKGLMLRVSATALAVLIGLQLAGAAVQAAPRLWSIVVHFEYADGFGFDYVIKTGVPTSELGAALGECGQSHVTGSVVRYHCYPVPE
jgi:hypothetical protein